MDAGMTAASLIARASITMRVLKRMATSMVMVVIMNELLKESAEQYCAKDFTSVCFSYFRLRNRASGPEIVDTAKPTGKGGSEIGHFGELSPPHF